MKMHLFNGSIKYGMFRNINMAELSCDLGIILFSAVLPHFYDSLAALSLFSVPFTPVFLLFALYFLPILFGNICSTHCIDLKLCNHHRPKKSRRVFSDFSL
jgi:hypothetical protein